MARSVGTMPLVCTFQASLITTTRIMSGYCCRMMRNTWALSCLSKAPGLRAIVGGSGFTMAASTISEYSGVSL